MTGLDLFERIVVVNVLRRIVKIENDFCIAVRQKAINRVLGIQSFVINKIVDKLIERKGGDVDLENHSGLISRAKRSASYHIEVHRSGLRKAELQGRDAN